MKNFGHIIAKLRKEKNLTQSELGKKLNVSYQAVSKWENNISQPDLETISKLTEIFEISIADFFALIDGKQPQQSQEEKPSQIKEKPIKKIKKPVDPLDSLKIKPKSNFSFKNFMWWLIGGLAGLVLCISLIVLFVPVTYNQNQVLNIINPSFFAIETSKESGNYYGTGVFVNSHGLAVTPYSVVEDATSGTIQLNNGKRYTIQTIVGRDYENNIALIQIDIENSTPARLSSNMHLKEYVYFIHYHFSTNSLHNIQYTLIRTYIDNIEEKDFSAHMIFSYYSDGGIIVNNRGEILGMGISDTRAYKLKKASKIKHDINMTLESYKKREFAFCDGQDVLYSVQTHPNELITPPENPQKTGYIFNGWYEDENYTTSFDFAVPPMDKTKCYAKWSPISYTINFDVNVDGENQTMPSQVFTYDVAQNLNTCTFEVLGKRFDKWEFNNGNETIYFAENEKVCNLSSENGGIVTLKATYVDIDYYIRYNDGFGNALQEKQLASYSQNAELWDCKFDPPKGYHFAGWTDNVCDEVHPALSNSNFIKHSTAHLGVVDVYAIWEINSFNLIISDGTNTQNLGAIEYNKPFTLPDCPFTPPQDKYFSHWEYSASEIITFEDKERISNLGDIENSTGYDVVLTAKWRVAQYTLRFETLSGEGFMEDQIVTCGEKFRINKNTFIKDGHIFLYWKCSKNGRKYRDQEYIYFDLTTVDGEIITLTTNWTTPLNGEGTQSNPYSISTEEEFNKFYTLLSYVESYKYGHTVLTNDIEFSHKYVSISDFYGVFDGQGHTITNANSSIFYDVYGTVKNLHVQVSNDNAYLSTEGIIAQYLENGIIENCSVSGTITLTSSGRVSFGGIVGKLRIWSSNNLEEICIIRNCKTDLTVKICTDKGSYSTIGIGGIVGYVNTYSSTKTEYSYLIENCIANTTVVSSTNTATNVYVGGIVGYLDIGYSGPPFWGKYANCVANTNADIDITAENYYLNTFAEIYENDIISNCYATENSTFVAGNATVKEDVERASEENLSSKQWWTETMLFDENVWLIEDGQIPSLKQKEEI